MLVGRGLGFCLGRFQNSASSNNKSRAHKEHCVAVVITNPLFVCRCQQDGLWAFCRPTRPLWRTDSDAINVDLTPQELKRGFLKTLVLGT